MNTREMATEYRLANWAEAMGERAGNKESIKAFCERKGISRNAYFYWQRKLRKKAAETLLPAPKAMEEGNKNAIVPQGWAICEAAEAEAKKNRVVTIEIGKCRIEADAETDEEALEKVCRTLVKLC